MSKETGIRLTFVTLSIKLNRQTSACNHGQFQLGLQLSGMHCTLSGCNG